MGRALDIIAGVVTVVILVGLVLLVLSPVIVMAIVIAGGR